MPTIREDGVAYPSTIQVFDKKKGFWDRFAPVEETSQEAIEKLLRSNNELLEKLVGGLTTEEKLTEAQDVSRELQSRLAPRTFVEHTVNAIFTRPDNTTQYAIADVVGDGELITFANVVPKLGGSGFINKARLMTSVATVTSAVFRLYLYTSPIARIADNAAFTKLFANRLLKIGHIDFALTTDGAGSDSAEDVQSSVNIPFVTDASTRNIYGVLIAKATYTPTALSQFFIELTLESFE